jgi:broad specificity phosphatase PhoE
VRVCLIRHASTAWNEEGLIQGRTDIPLSPAGREQVASWRLPDGFAGARCVTSPLSRARETAALLGFPDPPSDARLAEMSWGDFEGRRLADLREELGDALADNERLGFDFRPPGGETPREVAARLADFLRDEATALCDDLLLVAHKGVLRAALVLTLGWDMRDKPPVRYDPERALLLSVGSRKASFLASEPLRRGLA